MLEELVNSSNLSQSQLATCLHYEYVCSCGNSSSSEESMMLLPVPVAVHISKCIDKLLLTQTLSDRWFCNVCNAKQDCMLFVHVNKVCNILILHLKRFINNGSNIFRDNLILACNPYSLSLKTTTDNEISLSHSYKLVAQICHSGTFSGGHYWGNILNGSTQLKCNNNSVMPIKPDALNNRDSYVLFYIQSFLHLQVCRAGPS